MLRLDLSPPVPCWIDLLPGVRLHVRPMSAALWSAAQHIALAQADAEAADPAEFVARSVVAVAEAAILDWSGVGDADGTPISPSRPAIAALLARRDAWEAFNRLYLDPWYMVDAEKKGSAPSPDGISAGAPPIATAATAPAPTAPAGSTPPAPSRAG